MSEFRNENVRCIAKLIADTFARPMSREIIDLADAIDARNSITNNDIKGEWHE